MSSENMVTEFVRVKFTREELASLPQHRFDALIRFGVAANDINIFTKLLLAHNRSNDDYAGEAAIIAEIGTITSSVLQRRVVSVIFDTIALIEKCYKNCDEFKDDDMKSLFERIKAETDKLDYHRTGIAYKVRNHITNHYVFRDRQGMLNEFPEGHTFNFYRHNQSINAYSVGAEEIAYLSLLHTREEDGVTPSAVASWVLEAVAMLLAANDALLQFIATQHFPDKYGVAVGASVRNELTFDGSPQAPLLLLK